MHKALYYLRQEGIFNFSIRLYRSFIKLLKARRLAKKLGVSTLKLWLDNNLDGYTAYDSEYQNDCEFVGSETDIKVLAFYLPQFHCFKENDEWWGEGFTEWDNVRSGKPMFEGHYQPRVPHKDIGYYCLDDIDVLRWQAELARKHGIYGFCFYYYWFSGKRLMEKPVDMLLQHPEIDLPFCFCWANENWTRTWDGQNNNILISQEYSEDDDENFMADLKKYIDDPRYIRIHGKPLILVYNPGQIPDCHKSFNRWREKARELEIGEILIWTCQTSDNTAERLKIEDCIDAEVEFPPHNFWKWFLAVKELNLNGKIASIFNYQLLVKYLVLKHCCDNHSVKPLHRCCTMGWDNAARRKNNWFSFYAFSLYALYQWMLEVANYTRKTFEPEERFAFINAWNEWGEGTYLEPDEKYGYANINTISKALFGLPFDDSLTVLNMESPECTPSAFSKADAVHKTRIAVQIHLFYLDTLDNIIDNLNLIPYPFDCYISTDTKEKKAKIETAFRRSCKARKTIVGIYENRGRDVLPFLLQMNPVLSEYEYICHIHSKKTKTNVYGEDWRLYNFRHLFGNAEYIKRLFCLFERNDRLGIIMPETYPVLEDQAEWGGNREGTEQLLERICGSFELPEVPTFPVGNMFWARSAAVKSLFDLNLQNKDFPEEAGQINGTIAHQIERAWVYVAKAAGYTYKKVFNNCQIVVPLSLKKRLGIYVHYDSLNVISADDVKTVSIFSKILSDMVFVTNSPLPKEELKKVEPYVRDIKQRSNLGFDFGAWKDCLLELGEDKICEYDELILLNNSFLSPVFDMREIFAIQEKKGLDFWGITVFPYSKDGSYIHRECIPEHIQSYFMVFEKSVVQSKTFWDFWKSLQVSETLIDTIANGESQLTKVLADAGFSYEPYIHETYYLSRYLNNSALPYEKPTALLLLGDPLIKKKSFQYMSAEERVKLDWLLKKISKE